MKLAISVLLFLCPEAVTGRGNYMEEVTTCKDTFFDKIDWPQILTQMKNNDNDLLDVLEPVVQQVMRDSIMNPILCHNGVVAVFTKYLEIAHHLISDQQKQTLIAYILNSLPFTYLLDASHWPYTHRRVLEIVHTHDSPFQFQPIPASLASVTVLLPHATEALVQMAVERFTSVANFVAVVSDDSKFPYKNVVTISGAGHEPTGAILNMLLRDVGANVHISDVVLVVTENLLPASLADLFQMVRALVLNDVVAVGAPVVDQGRVYVDACAAEISMDAWKLQFGSEYRYSFRPEPEYTTPPCKLVELSSPTFVARTEFLAKYVAPIYPVAHGDLAVLELALAIKRRAKQRYFFAHCPESELLPLPASQETPVQFLWGRRDLEIPAEVPPFGNGTAPVGMSPQEAVLFQGERLEWITGRNFQLRLFAWRNSVREISGFKVGCTLKSSNCELSWLYKGWSIPPCCKRTLEILMEYLHRTMAELGLRYIITDGALLGSLKFGSLLDWDMDIDLHVHSEDYEKIPEILVPRIERDGYFIRKHPNGQSYVVQANEHNHLYIELNRREELFDDEFLVPVKDQLYHAMKHPQGNLTQWYGADWFRNKLRTVFYGSLEDSTNEMLCSVPGHHNCVEHRPSGADCKTVGLC